MTRSRLTIKNDSTLSLNFLSLFPLALPSLSPLVLLLSSLSVPFFWFEKVLKRKKGQLLVKWKGWPDKYNSWILNSELKKLSFYVTLPSHANKSEFPGNQAKAFKIQLPHPLHLPGSGWQVGLSSISLPDSKVNIYHLVPKDDFIISTT